MGKKVPNPALKEADKLRSNPPSDGKAKTDRRKITIKIR